MYIDKKNHDHHLIKSEMSEVQREIQNISSKNKIHECIKDEMSIPITIMIINEARSRSISAMGKDTSCSGPRLEEGMSPDGRRSKSIPVV